MTKFHSAKDTVLYTIARQGKVIKVEDVIKILEGTVKKHRVYNLINHWQRRNLIIKYKGKRTKESWSINYVGLNPVALKEIKYRLREHWQDSWGIEWEKMKG